MTSTPSPLLRCRPIAEADLADVAALLTRGFPDRTLDYWRRALDRLRTREAPADYPRFGLMLEAGSACVGVLLQVYARLAQGDAPGALRCNVSSWYVEPAFRGYAPLLASRALRHKEVTYLNVSPAPHTRPILEAQGYRRYSAGQFAALPAVSWPRGGRVRAYQVGEAGFPPSAAAVLDAHARMGLQVLVGRRGAERAAFAFLPRTIAGLRCAAQLVYCTEADSFARFAGPLGRRLLRCGLPLVILDARGPVAGLVGRFFKDRAPKYVRGGPAPCLNDLAYTEAVLFGA